MKKYTSAILLSLVLIALSIGLDQWTKYAVASTMSVGQSKVVIPKLMYLTYAQNTGAGFSLFEGAGIVFFSILTIAAMIGIVYYFFHIHDLRIQLCLALIFAGALGNFIDRLSLGYVRDFFSVYIFGWPFPIFNVADICISVGFILLLATYLYDDYKEYKHGNQNI